jgi:hypothetical protein
MVGAGEISPREGRLFNTLQSARTSARARPGPSVTCGSGCQRTHIGRPRTLAPEITIETHERAGCDAPERGHSACAGCRQPFQCGAWLSTAVLPEASPLANRPAVGRGGAEHALQDRKAEPGLGGTRPRPGAELSGHPQGRRDRALAVRLGERLASAGAGAARPLLTCTPAAARIAATVIAPVSTAARRPGLRITLTGSSRTRSPISTPTTSCRSSAGSPAGPRLP